MDGSFAQLEGLQNEFAHAIDEKDRLFGSFVIALGTWKVDGCDSTMELGWFDFVGA